MGNIYSGTRTQGLFAGRPMIEGPLRSKIFGLRNFLTRDTGSTVFYKEYPIHRDKLYLSQKVGEQWMREIPCPGGGSRIYIGVQQEEIAGRRVKVLYGWGEKNEWGLEDKVRVKYILAEKQGRDWRLLLKPEALSELTEHQQMIKASQELTQALTEGLGNAVLRKWWNVNQPLSRLTHSINGQQLYLDGFSSFKKVFSLISEEDGRVVARFYASEREADRGENLLKAIVFSEKSTDGGWSPLMKQKLLEVSPLFTFQHAHLASLQLKQFLLQDQEIGAIWEVGSRKVVTGSVRFNMDFGKEDGGYVQLAGFTGYDFITGRIVYEGEVKKAYFWPDEAAKAGGDEPIIPEGQVIARRTGGKWEIVWFDLSWGDRMRRLDTAQLGNYLFATVGDRVRTDHWPVKRVPHRGREYPILRRTVRQNVFQLSSTSIEGSDGEAVSQTREFGKRIKFIEFWRNEQLLEQQESPFAARFITFNLNGNGNGGNWIPFWHKVKDVNSTVNAFRRLIRKGVISFDELCAIFDVDYFYRHNYRVLTILDHLNPDLLRRSKPDAA